MTKELEPGLIDIEALGLPPSKPQPCAAAATGGGNPNALYALPGPQVEYQAAFWLTGAKLRMPSLDDIRAKLGTVPPYSRDPKELDAEITALKDLARRRDETLRAGVLSDFLNLQDPPFGAIFNGTRTQYRVSDVTMQDTRIARLPKVLVMTARELARMFENETPGLLHRHAVNWLLFRRGDVSPARQARIWAALDLTIYASMAAAWHFKWAEGLGTASFGLVSWRQRPFEYDPSLPVLYETEVNAKGNGDGDARECPCPSPGTPRHPAYPAGHSTYAEAASHVLRYFFRDSYSRRQLTLLSDNIGEARLWAGVHWRTDHTFGQQLGRAVAETIIDQLRADCVPPLDERKCPERAEETPPTPADLKAAEAARTAPCPTAGHHDEIPPRDDSPQENRVF